LVHWMAAHSVAQREKQKADLMAAATADEKAVPMVGDWAV